MIQLSAQRIRIAIDASQPFKAVADAITSQAITLPSGSALQFELLFYFQTLADNNLLDLSVYSAIVLQVQDTTDPHSGSIYFTQSIPAASFTAATVAHWNDGSEQQVEVFIPSAQNVVPESSSTRWLCIYGVSTDLAQDNVLLCAVSISGKDSGVPSTIPALPQPLKIGPKIPFVCGDGLTRDVTLVKLGNGYWTLSPNQTGYNGPGQASYSLYCAADGLYRDISLVSDSGVWTLNVNQVGHS